MWRSNQQNQINGKSLRVYLKKFCSFKFEQKLGERWTPELYGNTAWCSNQNQFSPWNTANQAPTSSTSCIFHAIRICSCDKIFIKQSSHVTSHTATQNEKQQWKIKLYKLLSTCTHTHIHATEKSGAGEKTILLGKSERKNLHDRNGIMQKMHFHFSIQTLMLFVIFRGTFTERGTANSHAARDWMESPHPIGKFNLFPFLQFFYSIREIHSTLNANKNVLAGAEKLSCDAMNTKWVRVSDNSVPGTQFCVVSKQTIHIHITLSSINIISNWILVQRCKIYWNLKNVQTFVRHTESNNRQNCRKM
jgi:hypothetical protein